MNILYLHRKSDWQCNELRFSLRSLQYVEHDNVYVAGYKPDWLTNVIHVPCDDKPNKYKDALNRLLTGLNKIDGQTLLLHDDMFLLPCYEPKKYYNGILRDRIKRTGGDRKQVLQNALEYLGADAKNYAMHYPMPFNASDVELGGYELISYMNVLGNQSNFGEVERMDCKYHPNLITVDNLIGEPCFSTYGETDDLLEVMIKLYPNKSKYEV